MGLFTCRHCGWMYEHMVSTTYVGSILKRFDHCIKCNCVREFNFTAHSGAVGRRKYLPEGYPGPSLAVQWWRKKRDGKEASAPLNAVCKRNEW